MCMAGIGIVDSSIRVVGYIAYGFEKNSVKPGRRLVKTFEFLLLFNECFAFFVRQTYTCGIRICSCGDGGSGACDE